VHPGDKLLKKKEEEEERKKRRNKREKQNGYKVHNIYDIFKEVFFFSPHK